MGKFFVLICLGDDENSIACNMKVNLVCLYTK